ncbi:MAG: aldo/keto reductase [Acidimicrobiales bacterium]|jgi:aryl-alcohol dehydrogenase-like predicted oxidoreductase
MTDARTFTYANQTVNRLGFGAMRITGEGIWGPPKDPDECRAVLRRCVELGVNLIDTADSYGPYVSEDLIREALHPYGEVKIATKAGYLRIGPNAWRECGRPDYLRQECEMSLRRLGQESIDLFQLHRIDPAVAPEEQFGLLAELLDEGKVQAVGLSEVSVEQIVAARKVVTISTVQNLYNVTNRQSEAVLEYCEREGIGFIPWYPVAAGSLARSGGPLDTWARQNAITVGQLSLAWLLRRSPVMLPIPGTSKVTHVEENCAAASITLDDETFEALEALGN